MDKSEFLKLTEHKDVDNLQSIVRTCSNTSQKLFDALQCETAQMFLNAKTPRQIRLEKAGDFIFEVMTYGIMIILGSFILYVVLSIIYLIYGCVRQFFKST